MEAQLTLDRENRLKDIESRVKEAKELVSSKEKAAREVSTLKSIHVCIPPLTFNSHMLVSFLGRGQVPRI
jgi:hypothetical protein